LFVAAFFSPPRDTEGNNRSRYRTTCKQSPCETCHAPARLLVPTIRARGWINDCAGTRPARCACTALGTAHFAEATGIPEDHHGRLRRKPTRPDEIRHRPAGAA